MKITAEQVSELRARYGAIDRLDLAGAAYAGTCELLGALSQDDLKMLADADIKFVSRLALNRVKGA